MGDEVGNRIGGEGASGPRKYSMRPSSSTGILVAQRDLMHAVGADHQSKRRVPEICGGQREKQRHAVTLVETYDRDIRARFAVLIRVILT